MADVPVQWWWVVLGLGAVLLVMLVVTAANAAQRRGSEDPSAPVRGWRRAGAPWWPAGTAVLLLLLVGVLLATPRVAGEYSSNALVSLAPRDPAATSADTMILLGPRYLTLLENPDVLQAAAQDAGTTEKALRDSTDATIESATLIVDITVDSDNAATAARNAQALADALIDAVAQDELVRARLIGSAVAPEAPSPPTLDQVIAAGALAALAGAVVIGLAVRRRVAA